MSFQVGELVEVYNSSGGGWYDAEITAVGDGGAYRDGRPECFRHWEIKVAVMGAKRFYCDQKFLRKKKPPRQDREMDRKVSWDDCAWRPTSVPA